MMVKAREQTILGQRIASGQAEPISDFEKELAQKIMRKYEAQYGVKKTGENRETRKNRGAARRDG